MLGIAVSFVHTDGARECKAVEMSKLKRARGKKSKTDADRNRGGVTTIATFGAGWLLCNRAVAVKSGRVLQLSPIAVNLLPRRTLFVRVGLEP
jgi:hypothetical protein